MAPSKTKCQRSNAFARLVVNVVAIPHPTVDSTENAVVARSTNAVVVAAVLAEATATLAIATVGAEDAAVVPPVVLAAMAADAAVTHLSAVVEADTRTLGPHPAMALAPSV